MQVNYHKFKLKTDVFISYSRKDTAIAENICKALDNAGITYFIDRQGIGGGMEFPKVLAHAILDCEIFLFLGSANSYESKFTNAEVTFAFNKKERNYIVPYLIDNSVMPIELEFTFSAINWRTASTHSADALADDLLKLLGREKSSKKEAEYLENLYERACILFDNKQYEVAASMLLEAAEKGHLKSQIKYADFCFCLGRYCPPKLNDLKQGLYWYIKAANQGDAKSQFMVGWSYCTGRGTEEDFIESAKWYLKAAEQNYSEAYSHLGFLYFEGGYGLQSDWKEAKKWYLKAVEAKPNTDGTSYFKLGAIAEKENDLVSAVEWYLKAAKLEHPIATKRLEELKMPISYFLNL